MYPLIQPTAHNTSLFRKYDYKKLSLAKLEQSLVRPFNRLMVKPEPLQNPNGYRQVHTEALEFCDISLDKLAALGTKKVEVIGYLDASKINVHVSNPNGRLVEALVSPPPFLDWGKAINSHEKKYSYNKPDRLVATMQWMGMVLTLIDMGVKVYIVTPSPERKEGVFVCDIGFVIDEQLFMSNMSMKERKAEMETIRKGVQIPHSLTMEGGDVCLFQNKQRKGVFVGISGRTSLEAAEWLSGKVQRAIVPVRLNKVSLHFDVPILAINGHEGRGGGALVYYPGVHASDIMKLAEVYGADNVHRLSKESFEGLRANVQVAGAGTAMVDVGDTHVEALLRKYGFNLLAQVPFFEIKKGGGSHHCSMLKLVVE